MKKPDTPLILGFDTSSEHCGAVILRGADILASAHEEMARGQAERLFPMIDEVLSDAGVTFEDLDAIGVGIGPGNFTGIRISVSAARGLSLSLGIPAVGVSLFDALALGAEEDLLLLSLKASRDRVYLQSRDGADIGDITIARLDALPDIAPGTLCIGASSDAIAQQINGRFAPARYAPASAIARLAADRWQTPHAPPAPLYVRAADAVPPSDPPPVILPDDA